CALPIFGGRGPAGFDQGGRDRERRCSRVYRGDRRLRRLPDPTRLRCLDCRNRRTLPCARDFPHLLRELCSANLVVLHAQKLPLATPPEQPRRGTCMIRRRRRKQLVVVGNGMVGLRTVEELLVRAPDRYDITIFGAGPQPSYNRILLSTV